MPIRPKPTINPALESGLEPKNSANPLSRFNSLKKSLSFADYLYVLRQLHQLVWGLGKRRIKAPLILMYCVQCFERSSDLPIQLGCLKAVDFLNGLEEALYQVNFRSGHFGLPFFYGCRRNGGFKKPTSLNTFKSSR